jgi:hypothetical protein
MKSAVIAVVMVTSLAAAGAYAASTTVTNSDNCLVVRLKPGENPPTGGMSTSITAGNGTVSGQTTTGNGVSVQNSGVGRSSVASSSSTSDRRPHYDHYLGQRQLHRLRATQQVRQP